MAGSVTNLSTKPQQQKIVQDIEECVKDLMEIFKEQKSPISDDNQTLQRFCAKLEHLFQIDMRDKYSLLGRKKDYWDFFCDCLSKNKGSNDGIKFVKSLGEHKTSVGKGRALIRFSLVHHRLPDSIQQCVINGKVTSDYYFPQSVWLQKEKSSNIISFLYDLNDVNFDLSSRGYDLDSAWPSFAKQSGGSFSWNPPSRRDSFSSLTSNMTDNTSVLNMSIPVFDTSEVDRLHHDLVFSENTKSELKEQMESLQEKKLLSDQSAWVTQGELLVVQDQLHNNLEKMENIQEKYHDLEKRHSELLKKNEKLETNLKDKVSVAEKATSELATQKLKYDTELETYQSLLAQSKSEIKELESMQKDDIFQLESTKNDILLELKSARQELKSEKDLMKKKSDDFQVLEMKFSSTEKHNRELLKKLESVLEDKGTEVSASLDAANKLGNMLDSLTISQTENTELKATNTLLEIQLSNLEEKFSELNIQKEKLTTEILELSTEKATSEKLSSAKLVSLTERVTDSSEKLNQAQTELKQKENECVQSEEKYTSALSNILKCFSDYNDFNDFNAKNDDFNINDFDQCLQSFLTKAVTEKQNLTQEITDLKATVDQKVATLSDSHDKIKTLNEEIKKLYNDKEEKEDVSVKKVKTKCEEIEELKKCLKDSEDNVLEYKTVVENQDKAILELYKELETNSENSMSDMTNSMVLLNKVCEQVKTQLAKYKSENTDMLNKLDSLESGETDKDKKIIELMQKLSNIEKQHCDEMSSNTDQLKYSLDKISSLEDSFKKSSKENTDLVKNHAILTKDLHELQEKYNVLSMEKSQLEISSTRNEENFQKTSSEIVNNKKDLETQMQILNSELASKTDEVSDLKSQVNVLNGEKKNLTKQIQDIGVNLDSSDILVKELTEKLESEKNIQCNIEKGQIDNEKQLSALKQQLEKEEKLKIEFKEKLEKSEIENDGLKSQIDETLKEIQVIKNQLQQTSTELEVMSSSKDNTEKENSNAKEELHKKIQLLEELQKELKDANSRNETILKEKSLFKDEVDGLKTELSDAENKLQKLTEETFSLTSRMEMMTQQFENQGVELNYVESKKLELETQFEETKNNLEKVSTELLDLKSKLSEKETELEQVQADNKELSECKRHMEKDSVDGNDRVMVLQKSRDELQTVVDTQIQEISALQFQLSSEQLQHEQIIKNYKNQSDDQGDLQIQVKEQENLLESLVQQLNELKANTQEEVSHRESQVEMIEKELQKKGEELDLANQKATLTEDQLEQERVERFQLQGELDALSTTVYKGSTEKDDIIRSLKYDNKEIKKRLVKLIKDKDVLWQMTDQLTFEQRQQAGEKWMDNSTVTCCLACKSEFSLFLRKHHCRLCGRIFCYNCSNNWMMTPGSSKKERTCDRCFKRHEMLEEQSLNSSVLSNNSLDSEEENELIKSLPLPSESSSSHDHTGEECSPRISIESSPRHEYIDDDEGTLPDSLQASSSPMSIERHSEDKEDQFHVITTEEISRSVSLTQADLMSSSIVEDPSKETSSVLLAAEDLIREEVNSQNETTVKPGKKYLLPVKIDTPNTTLYWQFTSKPKDIVFSVKYTANEPSPLGDCHILVEPCKCNSHIKSVEGELLAKEPGIYTLIFDNTYSKLTSKTVHYVLQCKLPSVN